MIARRHRFHGHKSVARVRGKTLHLGSANIYYACNKSRRDYRMAVVVSKKVSKSAIVRNRIRRRLFEAVRVSRLLDGTAVDTVFVVRDIKISKTPPAQLASDVYKACQKIADSCSQHI